MTLPARVSPGSLGTLGFADGGVQEFQDYIPRKGSERSSFSFVSDMDGQVDILSVASDAGGRLTEFDVASGLVVNAGQELRHDVQEFHSQFRVRFTAVAAGQVTARALDTQGPK